MSQKRLPNLALFSSEPTVAGGVDYQECLNYFWQMKARRVNPAQMKKKKEKKHELHLTIETSEIFSCFCTRFFRQFIWDSSRFSFLFLEAVVNI